MSHLYIHIPFCKKICYYCDFHFSLNLKNTQQMVDAICQEIILRSDYLSNRTLETIYFGGGTPSILTYKQISQIFQAIYTAYTIVSDAEISFEANPDDLTEDYIKMLSKTEINRISVGIQSFDDDYLKLMNRRHSGDEAKQCLSLLQEAGFENITADLIYGLPNLTLDKWQETIESLLSFNIKHISAYHLTIEPQTAFNKMVKTGKIVQLPDEDSYKQFSLLQSMLKAKGIEQYEISNFSYPEWHSRHNSAYWKQKEYIGIGPSAHSYNGHSRQWNISHNAKYITSIEEDIVPHGTEELSAADRYNECIFTTLRTKWGIDIPYLKTEFTDFYSFCENLIRPYILSGDVTQDKNTFKLTEKGRFLADKIASDLFWVE